MTRFFLNLRKTLWLALDHDVFNTAKAAAYSGMLCLFPAVVAVTSLLTRVPEGSSLMGEMRNTFDQFLPAGSVLLLQDSMTTRRMQSTQLLISAAVLAGVAGRGVVGLLLGGFPGPSHGRRRVRGCCGAA